MERIAILHEQAAVLRALAGSFEVETMRDQLLDLAARCDDMAKALEENAGAAGMIPAGFPDLH